MLKKLDIYIIKKFLGTFIFSIILIISIAVIFDFAENVDDFLDNKVPTEGIIFKYYLNFVPYFANLFSALFVFISVIFFTSKMASNTEIIAILSSGISFRRMLRPFFISAFLIAVFSWWLGNFIIPPANKVRIEFENKYMKNPYWVDQNHIHKQISPGVYIYMEDYVATEQKGERFYVETINGVDLVSRVACNDVRWNKEKECWEMINYFTRELDTLDETFTKGSMLDTVIKLHPDDFIERDNLKETMDYNELNDFIRKKELEGDEKIINYILEKHQRSSMPFAAFILTLIGVSVACRKVRGGIGLHLGLGLGLSFAYILFMQVSTNFAKGGTMTPILAIWLPNIIFSLIAYYLYTRAPK
ncbi:MAG: LptF/LptG family permease [Bacteroidales bacterium]|nr:LptF/LptG family permease [Bacteroidales bacterium]